MTASAPIRQLALVDDDEDFRLALAERLSLEDMAVQQFSSAESLLRTVSADFPGVVVTDLRMPNMDGRQLVERLMSLDPDLPVVMMTGHGDVTEAVDALHRGAYDFLVKPFAPDRLIQTLNRAFEKRALVLENRRLTILAHEDELPIPLSGDSAAAEALRAAISQLGDAQVDVLIEGETGSGKEAAARAIHSRASRTQKARRDAPFIAVACGGLPSSGWESQLFGHEAGAFAGALRHRIGQVEQAAGGTLFLDEVDLASGAVQQALLRVVEEREILPLGATEPRGLSLRILASTKVDPAQAVATGQLREDLYYRLNVISLRVPSLRERRDDIPLLFARFLDRSAARLGRPVPSLDHAIRRRLLEHEWPGNLRELANYASQTAVGMTGVSAPFVDEPKLADRVLAYEAQLIREALDAHGGEIRRVIEALGLPRKTLYDKMARHGIQPSDHRRG
jgi:Response regulator containing CheY-like receiver, AAA-type ATPase, and DNA-binding domains